MLTLIAGVLLLYLLTKSEALSAAHDSRWYLRMIENGEYFHPHHLLYNAVSALWAGMWGMVLPGSTLLSRVISLNSLIGALTVGLFFLLLRNRAGVTERHALIAALLPAFSFGLWFYSVTIEVYVLAQFFVLAALYVLTDPALKRRGIILAAALHGVSMLFHQQHLLFLLPALLALHAHDADSTTRGCSRLRSMVEYTVVAGAVVLLPYLYVGIVVMGMDTPERYLRWIAGYAGDGHFWIPPGLETPIRILVGFSRTLIGADFIFALPDSSTWIQRLLPGKWLADQQFVVRDLPSELAAALLVASLFFAAFLLHFTIRAVLRWRQRRQTVPLVLKVALLFIVVYGIFYSFWETTNVEFWIPQSLLTWLIVAALISPAWQTMKEQDRHSGAAPTFRLALLAGLLLLINGAGSIYWMMPRENDYYAVQAESLSNIAGREGVIMLPGTYMMESYLEPDQLQHAIVVSELLRRCDGDALSAIHAADSCIAVALAANRRIAVDGQCIAPQQFVILHEEKGYAEFVRLFNERYSHRLHQRPTPIGIMYVLKPATGLPAARK